MMLRQLIWRRVFVICAVWGRDDVYVL